MTDKPTPKEIDDLVYELRQAGKDDTYSLASAVLAKWGSPAPVGAEPVALLVRKNSWRDGQWEVAPPNSPSYGLAWANQRMYVYAAPQPTQPQAGAVPLTGEYPALVCDYCGALTPDPWHSSGMLHGKMSKHIHSCDACAALAAAPAQAAAPIQTLEEAIAHAEDKAKGNSACAMEHAKLAAWLTELQLLRAARTAQRDVAIGMLADWVNAVNTNGTGWDDWDEHFKDAAFRPRP